MFNKLYLLITLLFFTTVCAFYDYFSVRSRDYNVCYDRHTTSDHISYPDVNLETITTRTLFKFCFTFMGVVLFAAEMERTGGCLLTSLRRIFSFLPYVTSGLCWCGLFLWVVKLRVGRLRPCYIAGCKPGEDESCTNTNYHYYCQSFFSGHAMMACYLMGCVSVYVARCKLRLGSLLHAGCVFVAVGISYSRLLDHQHHLSDVIVGAAVGIFSSILVHWQTAN